MDIQFQFNVKHTLYRGKHCMKGFFTSLKERPKNIIDYEKNIYILTLTKEELKLNQDAKVPYICGKTILKLTKDKSYWKVEDHCHCTGKYRGAAHRICNLNLTCLTKFLLLFITPQIMIIILSLKN